MQETNWDYLDTYNNLEDAWTRFKRTYHDLVDKHIPHKIVKPGEHNKPHGHSINPLVEPNKESEDFG